jgi:hypothetical protein
MAQSPRSRMRYSIVALIALALFKYEIDLRGTQKQCVYEHERQTGKLYAIQIHDFLKCPPMIQIP